MSFNTALTTPFTPSQINRFNGIQFTSSAQGIKPFGRFNNDGYDDILVRMPSDNQGSAFFVVYGSDIQPPFPLDLSNLVKPGNGVFGGGNGEFVFSQGIRNIPRSLIGDLNGDRRQEYIEYFMGAGKVILSNPFIGFSAEDLTKIPNGFNGFRFEGLYEPKTLGDLNGDRIKEFSGLSLTNLSATSASVIFGRDGDFPFIANPKSFPVLVEPSLADGVNGFKIIGRLSDPYLSDAGDINGDGRDDLIVKANNKNYILLSPSVFPAEIDLNNFPSELWTEIGTYSSSETLYNSKLLPIGDVNGDGLTDLYLGATDNISENRIIYGGNESLPARLDFRNTGATVARTTSIPQDNSIIADFRMLGDINGDNIDDFILDQRNLPGPRQSNIDFGTVIFGRLGGYGDRLDMRANGFVTSNRAINIGDFNGDGINDLYAGNKIIFGGRLIQNLTDAQVDGKNGIIVGRGLLPIGDINGDRRVDLAGEDFVIYGTNRINKDLIYEYKNIFGGRAYNHNEYPDSAFTNADRLNFTSTATAPTWVYGGTGNDTLAGHSGYMDQLTGGDGADLFVFNLEFGLQKGKGFGVVWDFVPGVDKVLVNGTANDYFFVEDSNSWLDNPSFLKKAIDTSATTNMILARRDADLGTVMIGAFSDVRLSISDLSFIPNTTV
jgi:hypothetical protein